MRLPAGPPRFGGRRWAGAAAGMMTLLMLSGCALRHESNRPLTHRLSERVIPGSVGGRIAAAPVLLPLGAATLAIDAAVIHPSQELGNARRQTEGVCWGSFGRPGRYVTDCASLPVRAVLTPVYFVVNWGARIVGDLPPVAPPPAEDVFHEFPAQLDRMR